MGLKYSLNDIVSKAIMDKVPVVIVEGKDDRQIFQRVANSIGKKVEVYQVEEFQDSGPGCTNVIDAIRHLQPKLNENTTNERWILGIIDRDSRPFRETLPIGLKSLYITPYYSIETNFCTRNNLTQLLGKISFAVPAEIPKIVIDNAETNFHANLDDLYYISLEALKNACKVGYAKTIGYGDDDSGRTVTEIKSRNYILQQLEPKKADLDNFAASISVSRSDIKLIAKGKWYLFYFAHHVKYVFEQLKDECTDNKIPQCRSCAVENYQNCLYKLKKGYQTIDLYHDLMEFIDTDELADLIKIFVSLN